MNMLKLFLGGEKKYSNYEQKHICLSLGRMDDPVATAAFAAIVDPLPPSGSCGYLGEKPSRLHFKHCWDGSSIGIS